MAEPLICLMGPTAAGKTDAAVALAESFDVELISVDSALVPEDAYMRYPKVSHLVSHCIILLQKGSRVSKPPCFFVHYS